MTGTDSRTCIYSKKIHNQKHPKLWFSVTQNVISSSVKTRATPSHWYYKGIYVEEAHKSKLAKPPCSAWNIMLAPNHLWQLPWLSEAHGNSPVITVWGRKQPWCCTQRLQTPQPLSATGPCSPAASWVWGLTPARASFTGKHSPSQVSVNLPLWTRRKFSYPCSRSRCSTLIIVRSFLEKLWHRNLINILIYS